MSLADFREGFYATLYWCGVDPATVRDKPPRADFDAAVAAAFLADLNAFWAKHGGSIEAAPGLPGLRRGGVVVSTSWQAGHDLAFYLTKRDRNGRDAFKSPEWGETLSAAMRADAMLLPLAVVKHTPAGAGPLIAERKPR